MPDPVEELAEETSQEGEDTSALFEEFSNEGNAPEEIVEDPEIEMAAEEPDEEGGESTETEAVPPSDEGTQDPFASASDEVREAFAASQLEVNQLTHRLRSDEGRVSALHKKINALETAAQGEVVTPKEFANAFKNKDSWKEFAEDNPEMAKPIEEFMQGLAATTAETLEKTDKKVAQLNEAAAEGADQQAQDVMAETYPDWLDWIGSTDYSAWIAKQPSSVQAIVNDGTVEDSLALLGMYETHLKANGKLNSTPPAQEQVVKIEKKRSRQLQDGVQPPAKGGSAKPISDKDTPSLFDFFATKKAS